MPPSREKNAIQCFICGVDRFTFETKGDGFESHIHEDHWMWMYLAMMIHVREKAPTEYNGWETYVAAKMAAKDTSFLPRTTAIVLQASQIAEEARAVADGCRRASRMSRRRIARCLICCNVQRLQNDSAAILERLLPAEAGRPLSSLKQV